MYAIDHFFRCSISVNIGIITYKSGKLYLLLQQKEEYPTQDELGLPGKIILPNEETDIALEKLTMELLGTNNFYRKQLNAFSGVGRHPLGRVVSLTYYGLLPYENLSKPISSKLSWHSINEIPELCYDHSQITNMILSRLRKGLLRHPRVFEILPEEFTISDIIHIYEDAFSKKVDASNFGKQILKSNLLTQLDKHKKETKNFGRPARLFKFNKEAVRKKPKERIHFDF